MLTLASSIIHAAEPFGQAALTTRALAVALETVNQSLISTHLAGVAIKKRPTFAFLARHRMHAFRVRTLRALWSFTPGIVRLRWSCSAFVVTTAETQCAPPGSSSLPSDNRSKEHTTMIRSQKGKGVVWLGNLSSASDVVGRIGQARVGVRHW